MIPDKESGSNSWIVPKKHMSLTDECKLQLGISGGDHPNNTGGSNRPANIHVKI